MSSFIRQLSRIIDYYKESNAALDTHGARPQYGTHEQEWAELWDLVAHPPLSLSDLPAFLDVKNLKTVGLDDRKLLLEKLLVFMSRTKHTELSKTIEEKAIDLLYKDLPHPPSGYLCSPPPPMEATSSGPTGQYAVNYAFRTADGSNNNPLQPTLGKAGFPYARSVPSKNLPPRSSLPDAGLVFDTLLKRNGTEEHPGGISALFFAFADLVIHCIFNTDRQNPAINNASSYLDLSILYGSSEAQVNSVRRNDGTGKLLDDVFADSRLLLMPPASCALLILLCRNHNFIAQRILDINENGNLYSPVPQDPAERQRQDDEIFHRSRLVNCGHFMHIILGDYVGAILGLVRDGSDWRLDPLMTMREASHEFAPTGEGNVVSIEFNLLYRWHATLSEPDTNWITNVFEGVFEGSGTSPQNATVKQFAQAAHKRLIPPSDVRQWTFGGLKRVNGRFRDADLANILHNATETRAGAFGARRIPEVLKVVEVMAIEQSRNWGTCSLNEFRKFLGLKPYSSFSEWNPDPEIHTMAASLYKDIDNLELHVGLQAEEAKKPGPGAGLCPGFTISRAILADAVSLTRGDRFMTVEFTPHNLTAWGYQDCQYDTQDGSYGGLLTKLLFRTLPDYYPRGSSYAHFPFLQTSWMKQHLLETNPELSKKYTWDRPTPLPPAVSVDTFEEAQQLLTDTTTYVSSYDTHLLTCVEPILQTHGNIDKAARFKVLQSANKSLLAGVREMNDRIFCKPDNEFAAYFSSQTYELIKENSLSFDKGNTFTLDIVKDVVNLLPVYWISQIIGLPLKSKTSPYGIWYGHDLCAKFADISKYVYLNFDPVDDWKMRESSQLAMSEFLDYAKARAEKLSFYESYDNVGDETLQSLWQSYLDKDTDHSAKEFSAQVISTLVPTASLYSQAITHVINFYLEEGRERTRLEIAELVASDQEIALEKVMDYVYEALRFDPPVAGTFRTAAKDTILGHIYVRVGDHIFANILEANREPSICEYGVDVNSNPCQGSKSRPLLAFSTGLLAPQFLKATIPPILGAIFGLKGLTRAPRQDGTLQRFISESDGLVRLCYVSREGLVSCLPDSLTIQFNS